MSSMVARAMSRSKAANSGSGKVAAASETPKASLATKAMKKATTPGQTKEEKPREDSPMSENVKVPARKTTKEEIAAAEKHKREARLVSLSDSAENSLKKRTKGARKRFDTPFPERTIAPSDDDEEEEATPVRVKNLLSDLEKTDSGKKSKRSRSRSHDASLRSSTESGRPRRSRTTVQGATLPSSKSVMQSVIFRVAVALACGIVLYLVQKQFGSQLQLPTSISDSVLALPGPSVQKYIGSAPTTDTDAATLRNFRDTLKVSLPDYYNEELTTQKLWEMYLDTKERNGKLVVASGALFGFIVAGVLM